MALGTSRARNWGREDQQIALIMVTQRRKVAYVVRKGVLYLAASHNGVTLPFMNSVASLVNTRRGRWESLSMHDDHVIATGVSERDVIRATIEQVWR